MTVPLVSIVIPCFRQGHFLAEAIESALGQTHRPIEVIVVNDGSDDDTASVAAKFGERVVYVEQANAGLPTARNEGLAKAQGEFVVFLDADDLLHSNAVQWQLQALNGRKDGVGLMGFARFVVDPARDAHRPVLPGETETFLGALLESGYAVHCFLVPRVLLLELGGFDRSLRAHEDYDLWWRLAQRDVPLATSRELGAYYRVNPNGMTANVARHLSTRAEVLLRQLDTILSSPDVLSRWGGPYSRCLYGVRRELRLRREASELESRLSAAIRRLRRQGARVQYPLAVRIQDRLPSALSNVLERTLLSIQRRFVRKR